MNPRNDQNKESYLGRMRRVGIGIGRFGKIVGGELMKGNDALSPRKRMEKLGFGKTYAHFGRNVWSRPGQRVAQLVGLSKGLSYWKKKQLEQEMKNLDQRPESSSRQQVVEEEILEAAEELKKDPKMPKMWVDKAVRNLLAAGRFSGGKRRSKREVGKIVRESIPGEAGRYAASVFEGKEQYKEISGFEQTTQGEVAEKLKELRSRGVLKESDVVAGEKSLGAQEFPLSGTKEVSVASRSRWKISSFTGWGKKPSGDNEQ